MQIARERQLEHVMSDLFELYLKFAHAPPLGMTMWASHCYQKPEEQYPLGSRRYPIESLSFSCFSLR